MAFPLSDEPYQETGLDSERIMGTLANLILLIGGDYRDTSTNPYRARTWNVQATSSIFLAIPLRLVFA
jgi:hypothetical protein